MDTVNGVDGRDSRLSTMSTSSTFFYRRVGWAVSLGDVGAAFGHRAKMIEHPDGG